MKNTFREIRTKLGLQINEMAILLGIDKTMLQKIETGKRNMPTAALQKFVQISKVLKNQQVGVSILEYHTAYNEYIRKEQIKMAYQIKKLERELQTLEKEIANAKQSFIYLQELETMFRQDKESFIIQQARERAKIAFKKQERMEFIRFKLECLQIFMQNQNEDSDNNHR